MLLEKIDNTVREYNYLLTSQLEEQRRYFEEKVIIIIIYSLID